MTKGYTLEITSSHGAAFDADDLCAFSEALGQSAVVILGPSTSLNTVTRALHATFSVDAVNMTEALTTGIARFADAMDECDFPAGIQTVRAQPE